LSSASANTVSIPVTLTVSSQPLLSVTPATLTFGYQLGGQSPQAQTLSVAVTASSGLNYNITVNGGGWLKANPASGSTPASVSVSVDPSGLAVNSYSGTVTITAAGASNSPIIIPVVLQVVAQTTIAAKPSALQFAYQAGGTVPLPQSISITSAPLGVTVSLSASGGTWLAVGAASAVAPASIPVSVNPAGLKLGTYTGTVSITGAGAANNPQTVTVTLLVTNPTSLTAAPQSLNFTVSAGAPAPRPQAVAVGSTAGVQSFTVTTSATWLSAAPTSSTTPGSLTVSIDPAGLAADSYSAFLTLTPSDISNGTLTMPVNLTVTAPVPTIAGITDAASDLPFSIFGRGLAPGSIITVWGTALGPDTPIAIQLTSNGLASTTLDNTSLMINDHPSPLLLVSKNQINAIVPYRAADIATVKLVRNGVSSNTLSIPMAAAAPALFTADETGKGQGAILNQDGSLNSTAKPAAKGSVIVLYGDGAGQTNPAGVDGAITTIVASLLPQPLLPVTVQVGGQDATVLYAGSAPALVSGTLQVNVQIPLAVPSGNLSVVLKLGGISSQPGVTVAVQ
jgi:uncharacterized protein (TIGR03437 family)